MVEVVLRMVRGGEGEPAVISLHVFVVIIAVVMSVLDVVGNRIAVYPRVWVDK